MNQVHVVTFGGPVVEDKDYARHVRIDEILPALERGDRVVLRFHGVAGVPQSFVHALISEAFRKFGKSLLERFEFSGCDEPLRDIIATVVEYSLRARTLAQAPTVEQLYPVDVPQADNLDLIRELLDAMAMGIVTFEDLSTNTGFSLRHVQYRLQSARILALANVGRKITSLTLRGRELTQTAKGSLEEREAFRRAVAESRIVRLLAPALLGKRGPTKDDLTKRIRSKTRLAPSTCARRAQALLAWRRRLVAFQGVMFQ